MIKPLPLFGFAIGALALLAMAGCEKKMDAPLAAQAPPKVEAPVVAPAKPVEPKSAEPNTFDEVAARLDRGGSLFFYLGTEQWLGALSQQLTLLRDVVLSASNGKDDAAEREKVTNAFNIVHDLVKKSGLEDVTGFGASSFAIEPGIYRNKVFVHHHPGKGSGFIWSTFGKVPHKLNTLDLLPADTALASFGDLDLAQLIGVVRQTVEQSAVTEAREALAQALERYTQAAGMPLDDALKSLGGAIGFVLTLDPSTSIALPLEGRTESIPTPRLALVFQVNDDRIFNQIDKAMSANPGIIRVDELDLRMRTLPPQKPPQPAQPAAGTELEPRFTAAQWTGYFALASDEKLIRDMIAAQKDGTGFKATPEFAKLSAGLPEQGNGFQLVTRRFAETWNRLPDGIIKSHAGSMPQQQALVGGMLGLLKSGPAYSVSSHLDNGWLVVGKGSQSASQVLAPLLMVPLAVLGGVSTPVISKTRDTATATKSLSHAKQIGIACKLYALDNNGKFPPSLEALVPDYLPDAKLFVSPFAPEVPVGYSYTAGLTESSPAETVLIEDKFASRESRRVIVRVDMSAEVASPPGR